MSKVTFTTSISKVIVGNLYQFFKYYRAAEHNYIAAEGMRNLRANRSPEQ